jgi:hypothetical protein
MVLASALMRGIHPPDYIQNGGHPGGMPLISDLDTLRDKNTNI